MLILLGAVIGFTYSSLNSSRSATGVITFAINGHKGQIAVENTHIRYDTTSITNSFVLTPMQGYNVPTTMTAYILTSEPTTSQWNNAPSGWTANNAVISYSNGTISVSDTQLMALKAKAVYITGNCVPKNYTISYNANGGTGTAMATTTATVASNVVLRANTYTRTGYTFVGWGTSSTSKVIYKENETINASDFGSLQDITLYAVWQGNEYPLVLDNQDANESGTTATIAVYGQTIPNIAIPVKYGYNFLGYFTDLNGSGTKYYDSTGKGLVTQNQTTGTTLYAQWQRNICTITYDLNVSTIKKTPSISVKSLTVKGGDTVGTLMLPTTPDYYVFSGWYYTSTCDSGTQIATADGSCLENVTGYIANSKWNVTSNFTVYAKWTQQYPDYVYVSTSEDWFGMSSKNYMLINDLSFSGRMLTSFSGLLDGQGFTISGFSSSPSSWQNVGLFQSNSGTIKNLIITGANIKISQEYRKDMSPNAGFVVAVNSGTIQNVVVQNSVIDIYVGIYEHYYYCWVGGIAGKNTGTIEQCGVEGCNIRGFTESNKYEAASRVGGIAGISSGSSKIINCYSKSNTIYAGAYGGWMLLYSGRPKSHVGGLVGEASGLTLTNCLANSNVITAYTNYYGGDDYSARYGGLLIGTNSSSSVSNTYTLNGDSLMISNKGNVSSSTSLVGAGTSVGTKKTPSGSVLKVSECSGFSTSIWTDSSTGPTFKREEKEIIISNKTDYMHLSFDDVSTCFANLATGNYQSLWDEPFFAWLKSLNEGYGAKISLYTYTTAITGVGEQYVEEFKSARDWLKLGMHSNSSGNILRTITYDQGLSYWNDFASNVFRITGSYDSLDRMPRLEGFAGTKEGLLGMRDATCGALGFLSADDTRNSYYFNNLTMNYLYTHDYARDSETNLRFVSTDIRGDWFSGSFTSSNIYRTPTTLDVLDEMKYRQKTAEFSDAWQSIIWFTHEWCLYSGTTLNSKVEWVEDACQYASVFGVQFDYPQNRAFINNGTDNYLQGVGNVKLHGNSMIVKDRIEDMQLTAGYSFYGGVSSSDPTMSVGRSASVGYCLSVAGGERITQVISTIEGKELAFAVKEFRGDGSANGAGQTFTAWITGGLTLHSNTRFIIIGFKNGDGSANFSETGIGQLPNSLTVGGTMSLAGITMSVRETMQDMSFVIGCSFAGGSAAPTSTNSVGRAASIGNCLVVTGGQMVSLNLSSIEGKTLTYAIKEFKADGSVNTSGQTFSAWLSNPTTLHTDTKYIIIGFKNGDGSANFTESGIEQLSNALMIS